MVRASVELAEARRTPEGKVWSPMQGKRDESAGKTTAGEQRRWARRALKGWQQMGVRLSPATLLGSNSLSPHKPQSLGLSSRILSPARSILLGF